MKGLIFVALAAFIWAIDTLIRYPLLSNGLNPLQLVLIEHGFLVMFFAPYIVKNWRQFSQLNLEQVAYFLIIGGLGSAVATYTFTLAFLYINPTLVILMQKIQPVVAILLARAVLGESTHPKFLFFAGISLAGALLLSFEDVIQEFSWGQVSLSERAIRGYLLTLVAVVSWGASTVFGKKLTQGGLDEKMVMSGRYFFALLTLIVLHQYYEAIPFSHLLNFKGMVNITKVLVLALMTGVLAMGLYYRGLKSISARACALTELLFPFFAVLVNWIALNSVLTHWQIMGGLLCLFGAVVIQLKKY